MAEDFSSRLRELMDEHYISQGELAIRLRTSQSTVMRWLKGSMPRVRMLSDLAEALNTTPVWLAQGRGVRQFPPDEQTQTTRIAEQPRDLLVEAISAGVDLSPGAILGLCQEYCAKAQRGEPGAIASISTLLNTLQTVLKTKPTP